MRDFTQRYVAYYRVSTAKQGHSGSGIEAQREAVTRYIDVRWRAIVSKWKAASGDRPQLVQALAAANIRALATAGLLVTFASGASIAMPPQDLPTEVKSCKAIADDKERLRCFDGLFGVPLKSQNSPEGTQTNWSIDETKSTDGSPQVVAANLVGDIVLILRCKDQITEAAFSDRVQLPRL